MSFLLDTNVISELRKGEKGNAGVARWASALPAMWFHTSVLVIGELRRAIELKRRVDRDQAEALDHWFSAICAALGSRILPVDSRVADAWGRFGIPDALPVIDGLLAATAEVHGLTLVTRNVHDVKRSGVPVFNPFTPS
ncbi:MAG: type II toxin-antitoxin system VapC family toxin [Hyphomicrobiales bacterium]